MFTLVLLCSCHVMTLALTYTLTPTLILTLLTATQVVVEPAELDVARSHAAACEYVDTFAPGEEDGWAPRSAQLSL